jgi:hypothetical protein
MVDLLAIARFDIKPQGDIAAGRGGKLAGDLCQIAGPQRGFGVQSSGIRV